MNFRTLLGVTGVLGILFGLFFLAAPAMALGQYGVTTDATGLFMARFFGAALLYLGLIFLVLREVTAAHTSRLALAACLGELAGFAVALQLQLSGIVNALGWSSVVLYGGLALSFAALAFRKSGTG